MTQLHGKIALITGAAGGFGEGIARLFVAQGARVMIADLDGAKAAQVAASIGPSARAVACDGGCRQRASGSAAPVAGLGQACSTASACEERR